MGSVVGILLACSTHLAGFSAAITLFQGSRALAATTSELEIEVAPDPPEPPAPPPPPEVTQPPPPPPPPKPEPKEADPYEKDDLPPPPAEAAKVLTAPDKPNDPPPTSDQTFASGNGTGLGVGMVAGAGKGDSTTWDPRAHVESKAPPKPPETKPAESYPDLSRPASPFFGFTDDCAFPSGADGDSAVVPMIVTVGADGKALAVEIIQDPGAGFGSAARSCAMRLRFRPARDPRGQNIVGKTKMFRFRFTR
jgi:protein TonB